MADRKEDRHKFQRNHPSGAQKRKEASEREKHHEQLLSKIPKINTFFSVHGSESPISSNRDSVPVSDRSGSPSLVAIPIEPEKRDNPATINSDSVSDNLLLDSDEVDSGAPVANQNENYLDDVGLWKESFTGDEIEYWIKKGSKDLQHCDEKLFFKSSFCQERTDVATVRRCSKNLFSRILQNKEFVQRSWLCFPPSTGKVYCYICKLMSDPSQSKFAGNGYCNWKKAAESVSQHEVSKNHLDSIVQFSQRSNQLSRVDQLLEKQVCNFYERLFT